MPPCRSRATRCQWPTGRSRRRPGRSRSSCSPHEVAAELHGGELPAELLARQRRRVGELGFEAINMPKELGGGFSAFQQVLVQEQVGRATNALGWVIHTPASWLPQVATDEQLERWVLPSIRGERRG